MGRWESRFIGSRGEEFAATIHTSLKDLPPGKWQQQERYVPDWEDRGDLIVIEPERQAPANGNPFGTISWTEHEQAWQGYHRKYPNIDQDAEKIAERGGFGWSELRTRPRQSQVASTGESEL